MRKIAKSLILLLLAALLLAVPCAASGDSVSVSELIEHSAALEGTQVTIQGEAIGEALERGEYGWLNLADATGAIGVWVRQSDLARIRFYGDYKHKGDTVCVTGTFYGACAEHGGDFDVHVSSLTVVEAGHPVTRALSGGKLAASAALSAVAALVFVCYRVTKRA